MKALFPHIVNVVDAYPESCALPPSHRALVLLGCSYCNPIPHAGDWFRKPGLSQSVQGTPLAIGIDPYDPVKATRWGGMGAVSDGGCWETRVPALRSKLPEIMFFLLLDVVIVKGKA